MSLFTRTAQEHYQKLKQRSDRLKAIEEAIRNGDIDRAIQLGRQNNQDQTHN